MQNFKIALAQLSPHVGDIVQNAQLIRQYAEQARDQGAAIVVFPELSLIGYPAEDLLLRPSLQAHMQQGLDLLREVKDIVLVVGCVHFNELGERFNSAALIKDGVILGMYHKQNLPNYSVFDEKRYFSAGQQHVLFEHNGHRFAIAICEDIWVEQTAEQLAALGAQTVLVLNASPYEVGKPQARRELLCNLSQKYQINLAYVTQVGGQDDLIFDGSTMLVQDGQVLAQAARCDNQLLIVEYDSMQQHYCAQELPAASHTIAEIYQLLVMSLRDYVNRSGFKSVILGLSGGIDSALTVALAVDALGANRVQAVMMPYTYTAQISVEDAAAQAQRLGITFAVTPIAAPMQGFMQALAPYFVDSSTDTTEENLQARIRGSLLMALSNKFGSLVLSTGNKSELAVGYCTLYGDMVGGFAPLKDVYKTIVYELAKYRNSLEDSAVIPERVIERAPSAELRPDQTDQDSLPPYDVLDQILFHYIEEDVSQDDMIAKGFDAAVVQRVVGLVDRNEFKRRQGAIGPRISSRAFGRERRYPIVNGWKAGQ